MKQRLTVVDLAQLSPEQQEKLREWWKEPQIGDTVYYNCPEEGINCTGVIISIELNWQKIKLMRFKVIEGEIIDFTGNGSCPIGDKCVLPLLSLGQLIQLLESYDRCINITNAVFYIDGNNFSWEVRLRHLGTLYYGSELIDALWQAVKEVL